MSNITFIFWYWWLLAFVFLILEMLVPCLFFLWLGVSGLVTGVGVLITPSLTPIEQIICFSLIAIAQIFTWKFYGQPLPKKDVN